jgi:putative transcriptional regulator
VQRFALLFLSGLALAAPAAAQVGPPNGLLLVASPGLQDPRFRETVVLVTQAPDASTVGVILNRPTQVKLSELRRDALGERHGEPLYFGGPVMERSVIALFRTAEAPQRAVFHVHRGIYLSMHPSVIEPLLAAPPARLRLFAGFSGWAPRQLQGELERKDWHVLPVTEDVLFRSNPAGLWEEMLGRAGVTIRGKRAALYWPS